MTAKRQRYLKQAVTPVLAKPGDPLVRADGSIIHPKGAKKDVGKDQPKIEPHKFKPSRKRSLDELPAKPQVINGCAVVIFYTLMGLSDREIATAANIRVEDVANVRDHPAYGECFDIVSKEFVNANSNLLSARVAAYAHNAVTKIADIAQNGEQESNQLKASMHLYDSATGNNKGGMAGGANGSVNELRIIITEGDKHAVSVELKPLNGERHGEEEYETAGAE